MTQPQTIQDATLDERLAYIDIFIDSAGLAKKQLVAEGAITPYSRGFPNDERRHPDDVKRGEKIGARASQIIAQEVLDRGMNPAVISDKDPCTQAAYAALVASSVECSA